MRDNFWIHAILAAMAFTFARFTTNADWAIFFVIIALINLAYMIYYIIKNTNK
jgi:hypothetical protein